MTKWSHILPVRTLAQCMCTLLTLATALGSASADEPRFTVMVYNVENLFDADGLALFDDYQPLSTRNASPYSPAKTLTKLQNITQNVAQLNAGHGPDIILFQEFERDLSPGAYPYDYAAFLQKYSRTTVDAMLTTGFSLAVADLPPEALMLKYFEDKGLNGYTVAVAPDKDDKAKAHNNVVFSRFPILNQKCFQTRNARPIQVVTVEAYGSPVILINVHWKSGASHARTEDDRIANAYDTRRILDSILAHDPYADVIIAGDLNTHYNAAEYFPTVGWNRDTYAISVLGSQGDELAIRDVDGPDLYNLWFELPKEERASELYQGVWGTLIQMLITRGMYDRHGVQYIDGSFRRLEIPGTTTRGPFHEPVRWYFLGDTGGGFSDHLPIAADFLTLGEGQPGKYMELKTPSREPRAPACMPRVDFTSAWSHAQSPDVLKGLEDRELPAYYSELYTIDTTVIQQYPLIIRIEDRDYEVFSPVPEVKQALSQKTAGDQVRFIGQLSEYGGKPQFVILDSSWLK